ncbi:MAG TPA: hypothetical protein PK472_15545, partial [Pseudomonadota bacterium]|nr:hypothetical protein [Pseudomonadota bacterium]
MHCRSLFQTTSGNSVFRLLARFLPTVALLFTLLAPGLALAQNAKLRLERFGFDKLPDLKVYIT